MNKHLRIAMALLIVAGLASCAKEGGLAAGTATAKSMLQLVPADARGVIMINVHKALTSEPAVKALKDEATKKKYDELVAKVGIDPLKDVYFVVIAGGAQPEGKRPEGALIINARFNKANLLAQLKKLDPDRQEETYQGTAIYRFPETGLMGAKATPVGAFLDDSNIVLGSEKGVQAVIDVFHKKADPVRKNAEMEKLFKSVNLSAAGWGAFAIPPDMLKKAVEAQPLLKSVEGMTGVTMSFDYAEGLLVSEIQGLGASKEQNKQLAEMLNGVKAMGAGAAQDKPALTDLLNAVEVTSGDGYVKIYAALGSELLDKVRQMAQAKAAEFVSLGEQGAKRPPADEKKPETEVKK